MRANEIGFSGLGVTTKPRKIKEWLKQDNLVVFSTYQSVDKIGRAICDEAHKTAQAKSSQFSYIHKDSNIFCKKRLYMTATPKVLSSSIQEEAKQYIYDMNKQNIFRSEFYRMSFKEAIDQKILCDYKIRAVGVSDEETSQYIRERKFLKKGNMTTEDYANHIASYLRKYIWERDGGQCTYVHHETKRCCSSRHLLQIDHIQPFALGGRSEKENLRFLCAGHNQYRR